MYLESYQIFLLDRDVSLPPFRFLFSHYLFSLEEIVYIERILLKEPCMDDRIAISRLKQGDLAGLEARVNRYQVQAVHTAY